MFFGGGGGKDGKSASSPFKFLANAAEKLKDLDKSIDASLGIEIDEDSPDTVGDSKPNEQPNNNTTATTVVNNEDGDGNDDKGLKSTVPKTDLVEAPRSHSPTTTTSALPPTSPVQPLSPGDDLTTQPPSPVALSPPSTSNAAAMGRESGRTAEGQLVEDSKSTSSFKRAGELFGALGGGGSGPAMPKAKINAKKAAEAASAARDTVSSWFSNTFQKSGSQASLKSASSLAAHTTPASQQSTPTESLESPNGSSNRISELVGMGFSEAKAKAAVRATVGGGLDQAVDWIVNYGDTVVDDGDSADQGVSGWDVNVSVDDEVVAPAVPEEAVAPTAVTTTTVKSAPVADDFEADFDFDDDDDDDGNGDDDGEAELSPPITLTTPAAAAPKQVKPEVAEIGEEEAPAVDEGGQGGGDGGGDDEDVYDEVSPPVSILNQLDEDNSVPEKTEAEVDPEKEVEVEVEARVELEKVGGDAMEESPVSLSEEKDEHEGQHEPVLDAEAKGEVGLVDEPEPDTQLEPEPEPEPELEPESAPEPEQDVDQSGDHEPTSFAGKTDSSSPPDVAGSEAQALLEHIADLRKERDELMSKVAALEVSLEDSKDGAKSEIQKLETKLESTLAQLEAREAQLTSQAEAMADLEKSHQESVQRAEKRAYAEGKASVASSSGSSDELQEAKERGDALMAEGLKLAEKAAKLEGVVKNLKIEAKKSGEAFSKLQEKLEETESKFKKTKEELDAARSSNAAAEGSAAAQATLRAKDLEIELESLKQDLEESRRETRNAESSVDQAVRRAVSSARSEEADKANKVATAHAEEISALKKELSTARSEALNARAQAGSSADAASLELTQLRAALHAAEARAEEAAAAVPAATAALTQQLQAVEAASASRQAGWEEANAALAESAAAARAEAAAGRDAVSKAKADAQEAKAQAAEATSRANAAVERASIAEKSMSVLESTNKSLEGKVKGLEMELEALRARSDGLMKELATARRELTVVGSELNLKKSELSKVEEALAKSQAAAAVVSSSPTEAVRTSAGTGDESVKTDSPSPSVETNGSAQEETAKTSALAALYERSLRPQSGAKGGPGSSTSRDGPAHVSAVEGTLALLQSREGELRELRELLRESRAEVKSLSDELVANQAAGDESKRMLADMAKERADHEQLKVRHLAALEMLGEKTETVNELRQDLDDVKNTFRVQVVEMLAKIERLEGKSS